MQFGILTFKDIAKNSSLAPSVVLDSVKDNNLQNVLVAEINPELSDTALFCETYGVDTAMTANCVIVEAKRADKVWYAACVILATDRADINGIIRKHLNAKKVSFASMDFAVTTTGMEYGGITPIGLPADWPIIVDSRIEQLDNVLIGSGFRKSKLVVPGSVLASLPNAVILNIVKAGA